MRPSFQLHIFVKGPNIFLILSWYFLSTSENASFWIIAGIFETVFVWLLRFSITPKIFPVVCSVANMSFGGPPVIATTWFLKITFFSGKTDNIDAKRQTAFDILYSTSIATFYEFPGGHFESDEYQTFSFCLYRNRVLSKRKNRHVLCRPGFEGNKPLTLSNTSDFWVRLIGWSLLAVMLNDLYFGCID